jgi:hypothetical protein
MTSMPILVDWTLKLEFIGLKQSAVSVVGTASHSIVVSGIGVKSGIVGALVLILQVGMPKLVCLTC